MISIDKFLRPDYVCTVDFVLEYAASESPADDNGRAHPRAPYSALPKAATGPRFRAFRCAPSEHREPLSTRYEAVEFPSRKYAGQQRGEGLGSLR
jgi:hypothetical protein